MSSVEIYLIRHGKTVCNEKKLYCGKSDVNLSDNGRRQLYEIKNNLKISNCDAYYTTGKLRTNETLKILFGNVSYSILEDLGEYDFGDFEMKSYDELKEKEEYINWITDEHGEVFCPNGESKNQYHKRIENGFNKLLNMLNEKNIKRAVLVCHGGTIGKILEIFYDNRKGFYEYQPSCGRGYMLHVELGYKNIIKHISNI